MRHLSIYIYSTVRVVSMWYSACSYITKVYVLVLSLGNLSGPAARAHVQARWADLAGTRGHADPRPVIY